MYQMSFLCIDKILEETKNCTERRGRLRLIIVKVILTTEETVAATVAMVVDIISDRLVSIGDSLIRFTKEKNTPQGDLSSRGRTEVVT
ncbi:hypothetical protein ACTXT7_004599 [Hymenolepis weldensis]